MPAVAMGVREGSGTGARIEQVALELFGLHGPEQVTIEDVAETAGVSG